MRPMKTASAFLITALMICGCAKKKVTPPLEDLVAGVDYQLLGYHQYYAKDTTGMMRLISTGSTAALGINGSFLEDQIMTSQDSLLPDASKGYYNRIRLVGDTLEEQYCSPVAGQPMTSHLKCAVVFTEGTPADLAAGKKVKMTHAESGLEEMKAMYVTQLEREYTPMVTKLMWEDIEKRSAEKFTKEEVHERYRLTVTNRVDSIEVPKSVIQMKGDSAIIWYPNRLYFSLKFTGKIEILK